MYFCKSLQLLGLAPPDQLSGLCAHFWRHYCSKPSKRYTDIAPLLQLSCATAHGVFCIGHCIEFRRVILDLHTRPTTWLSVNLIYACRCRVSRELFASTVQLQHRPYAKPYAPSVAQVIKRRQLLQSCPTLLHASRPDISHMDFYADWSERCTEVLWRQHSRAVNRICGFHQFIFSSRSFRVQQQRGPKILDREHVDL